ncbi:MAG: hypothetical protein M5U25_20525 [Planctomycetota bacterium]|nr:hypothetical protein [Planctomycetota bacterium]
MALFDWLKRGKPKPAPVRAPGLIVLLDALPEFDPARAARELAAVEPLRVAPASSSRANTARPISTPTASPSPLWTRRPPRP